MHVQTPKLVGLPNFVLVLPNSSLELIWSNSFELTRISPILDVQGPDYFFCFFYPSPNS